MSRIRIKNFGPIKEGYLENDGWLDVKKVTVFIGNQGSGKSTVAKLISVLSWFEKAVNRGDINLKEINRNLFLNLLKYQGIENYHTKENTLIEYNGDKIKFKLSNDVSWPQVEVLEDDINKDYSVPKIMYVPAERNFLSVIKGAFGINNLPNTLYTFAEELRKIQIELKGTEIELPIGNTKYFHDLEKDISYIQGSEYKLDIKESSSGFQSFVPLILVSKFLSEKINNIESNKKEQLSVDQSIRRNEQIANVMLDHKLRQNEKNQKVREIELKYLNRCFINIVEEPEQNLFPSSQRIILNKLLEYNNSLLTNDNKLIITTHSPYIINYLTLAVKAGMVMSHTESNDILKKLNQIVPIFSLLDSDDLAIYEMDENTGTIKKLPDYKGLPSDENYLNSSLEDTNELFAQLLEIQQSL